MPAPRLLVLTVLAALMGLAPGQPAGAQEPAKKELLPAPKLNPFIAKAVEPDPKDSPLRKLQKERCRERAAAVVKIEEVLAFGRYEPAFYSDYVRLQSTLAENLAELMDKPADKVKCYEMRLNAMKEWERFTKARVESGTGPPQDLNLARAARLDAEIDLLKVKESVKGGK